MELLTIETTNTVLFRWKFRLLGFIEWRGFVTQNKKLF